MTDVLESKDTVFIVILQPPNIHPMILLEKSKAGSYVVMGFTSMAKGRKWFEESYSRSSTAAVLLHMIQVAPVIVPVPEDQEEFVALTRKLGAESTVFVFRTETSREYVVKLHNKEEIAILVAKGQSPDMFSSKIFEEPGSGNSDG